MTTTEIDWLQDYVRKSNNANQTNGAQRPLSAGQGAKGDEQSEEDDEDEENKHHDDSSGNDALLVHPGYCDQRQIHLARP